MHLPNYVAETNHDTWISSGYEYLVSQFHLVFQATTTLFATCKRKALLLFAACLTSSFTQNPITNATAQTYLLGLGIGDVTGPVVETNSE